MLRAAFVFFILALISMVFGSYEVAGVSMEVGKFLVGVFLSLALITFVSGLLTNKDNKKSYT